MLEALEGNKPRGPLALGGLINSFLRENNLSAGGAHQVVFDAWKDVTEEQGTPHTRAVLFRKGHLTVEVGSAALAQELSNFTGENLRTRINERFQKELIRKISFKIRG